MQREIEQCLQQRMEQVQLSDLDRQNLLRGALSQASKRDSVHRKLLCVISVFIAALVMLGFARTFSKGYLPDFFYDRSALEDRTQLATLYDNFVQSGKLRQFSDQLVPGEIGRVTYRNLRGSLEAVVLRGDTLDAVIPSISGQPPTGRWVFYHDPAAQPSDVLSQDAKSYDSRVLQALIENGNFAVCLPTEQYAFQWITTYRQTQRKLDYISMIGYETQQGKPITITYHTSSHIYRDLDRIRAEDVVIAEKSFVFVTSDPSFATIEEIYYFFESEYEHLRYPHVVVHGKLTVAEAEEIAADLTLFNEENLPIPGVDAEQAAAFLDAFPDTLLTGSKGEILERLGQMEAQEEGVVWEKDGRRLTTHYGNPYGVALELTGFPYSQAAVLSRHRPAPFEDFPWFPAGSLYRVKSYYDATVYEFARGEDYGDIPYCSITLVDEDLQAGTELDMLVGSHFFLSGECKIVEKDGVRLIVSKADDSSIAVGAVAREKGQYYYYRINLPLTWFHGDDWEF